MKKLALLFIIFIGVNFVSAQSDSSLSSLEKAYIYHTVRKTPLFEQNIGNYIVYNGKPIVLPNGEINYDSTEQMIYYYPDSLTIMKEELQRCSKGILLELANKTALWEFKKVLRSYLKDTLYEGVTDKDVRLFGTVLIEKMPSVALLEKEGELVIHPGVLKITQPSLSVSDRMALLENFPQWNLIEKKQAIEAFYEAVNHWTAQKTQFIFSALGGTAKWIETQNSAVGNGINDSGDFIKREEDQRSRWTRGLPSSIQFFEYQLQLVEDTIQTGNKRNPQKIQKLVVKSHTDYEFQTVGLGKETVVHFDVWGYNPKVQTTVIVIKDGYYYPLFGMQNTRFLAPDTTQEGKRTYYGNINQVRQEIFHLRELIRGKKGINYWIEELSKERDDTELKLLKTEKELSVIRRNRIVTRKGLNTDSKRKQRGERQNSIVSLTNKMNGLEKEIEELKQKRVKVQTQIHELEVKLQAMEKLIGTDWVCFQENDGLYLYTDSTRFDKLTQELTFPATDSSESIRIRLLSVPKEYTSTVNDETMVHFSISSAEPMYQSQLSNTLEDVFKKDDFQLDKALVSLSDSIGIVELFNAILAKKEIQINAIAGGVGVWKNNRVTTQKESQFLNQLSPKQKRLNTSYLRVRVNRNIDIQVESFTAPYKSEFQSINEEFQQLIIEKKINKNQLISAYRCYQILFNLKRELTLKANMYLSDKEAKKVIKKISKAIKKSDIKIGDQRLKYSDF